MTARGDAVAEQIRLAMQSSNPSDIVTGVKSAVADEVRALSPDADVELTDYFNHSYMPDFVLRWTDGHSRDERPIFLRTRLRPAQTAQDLTALATQEPVMVALVPPEREQQFAGLRKQARQTNRVLVTDIGSLADVAGPTGSPQLPTRTDNAAPLLRLVQANLLKGGRGLLTAEDAQRLTRDATPAADDGLDDAFLTSFRRSADELFAPDAALRLQRAAELLRFGAGRDEVGVLMPSEGKLSDSELRVLLPYLLSDPNARRRSQLWTHIGDMMSLQQLEDMWDVLSNVDLSVLIVPNLRTWTAKRAQLVLSNTFDDSIGDTVDQDTGDSAADDVHTDSSERRDGDSRPALSWHVRNRLLVGETGPVRLLISTDARRLKGRRDSPAAHWDDISPLLDGFALDAVDLLGAARRILVRAEQSGDVGRDVALIRANIEDSFYVREILVRDAGDEDTTAMNVDFTEMTVTADWASLGSIVRASAILGYRQSVDFGPLLQGDAGGRAPEPT